MSGGNRMIVVRIVEADEMKFVQTALNPMEVVVLRAADESSIPKSVIAKSGFAMARKGNAIYIGNKHFVEKVLEIVS
jgi:hypothetical protein